MEKENKGREEGKGKEKKGREGKRQAAPKHQCQAVLHTI